MVRIMTTGLEQFAPEGDARLRMVITGRPDSGKGHPLSTKLLTPDGYVELGKLQEGDEVIGSDGRPTRITHVHERGVLPVLRVAMSDNTSVLVDPEHLWRVRAPGETGTGARRPWRTVATKDLGKLGLHDHGYKWEIPKVLPVEYPEAVQPIHPYVMGVLLGNGYFGSDHVQITIPHGDEWEDQIQAVRDFCSLEVKERTCATSTARQFGVLKGLAVLRDLGLEMRKSPEKYIPEIYMRGSLEQRMWLIAGMMDTDGGYNGGRLRGDDGRRIGTTPTYFTTSHAMSDDFAEVIRSMGGFASMTPQDRSREGKPTEYNVRIGLDWNPFKFGPKAKRWERRRWIDRRAIKSITPEGAEPIRCITVEAPDSLYVTEYHIVTHNSRIASYGDKPIYAACETGIHRIADRKVPFAAIKSSQDMLDLLEKLRVECMRPWSQRPYRTLVVDTIDGFQRIVQDEWTKNNNAQGFATGHNGRDAWSYLALRMQMLMTRMSLLDMHVTVICHVKDKAVAEGQPAEIEMQLEGKTKNEILNDPDLIGYIGLQWAVVNGQRVQKRTLTFRKTPDKMFLKDNLMSTPAAGIDIDFSSPEAAQAAYDKLLEGVRARMEVMPTSQEVEEVPRAQGWGLEVPVDRPVPLPGGGGALAPAEPAEAPLTARNKIELMALARGLGCEVKGNSTKGELIVMIEEAQSKPVETPVEASTEVDTPETFSPTELSEAAALPQCAVARGTEMCVWDKGHDGKCSWDHEIVPTVQGAEPVDTKTGEIRTELQVEADAVKTLQEGVGATVIARQAPIKSAPVNPAPARPVPAAGRPENCGSCGESLQAEPALSLTEDRPLTPAKKEAYLRMALIKRKGQHTCVTCYLTNK